ncbi:MAG: hypothetical protein K2I06_04765 [Ruminococcus sp.]|nr:hypothetical protein [Ruminococcus sp.]
MRDLGIWLYVTSQYKLQKLSEDAHNFLYDEEGDTNFLSVIILLGIGLALAAVFIIFKDKILGWVKDEIGTFFSDDNHTKSPI